MNPERFTPYTVTRCEPKKGWLWRHQEDLLDLVVLLAVAFMVWLAITDDDPPSADGATTEEVRSHE